MQLKGFQRPKKLEWDRETLSNCYGKFTVEPFERGFGITIGNSLRRTLLSALSGAAITAVKIESVYHEFATIPGVVEDVADIILNLKQVRLRLHSEGPKTVCIKAINKSGEIKAGDIIVDPDVEILNPDLHIATLDSGASLEAELTIERGRGYVTAEENKKEGQPIGVIPIDANFSPIKKTNFWVENTFLGEAKAYDRLVLELWTDGGLNPEEAIANASKILKDHWNTFINLEEPEEEKVEEADEQREKLNEFLDRSVNELELSVRAYNCLKNANIKTIRDLVQKTDAEMLKTKNFGRKSLSEIKEILVEMNLGLGIKPEDLPKPKKKKA